jgi:hypothetical protein
LRASDSIDALIERRVREKSNANELEEMYAESTRRHREKIREANRWGWARFYERLAENHAKLAEENRKRAAELLEGGGGVR